MIPIFARFIRDDNGATAIEYALIGTIMSVVLITTLVTFGPSLSSIFAFTGERLRQEAAQIR